MSGLILANLLAAFVLAAAGDDETSALAAENPFVLDLYGAVPVEQVSMGITSDRTTALTTYRDALALTEALGERGVDSLVVNYQDLSHDPNYSKKH